MVSKGHPISKLSAGATTFQYTAVAQNDSQTSCLKPRNDMDILPGSPTLKTFLRDILRSCCVQSGRVFGRMSEVRSIRKEKVQKALVLQQSKLVEVMDNTSFCRS